MTGPTPSPESPAVQSSRPLIRCAKCGDEDVVVIVCDHVFNGYDPTVETGEMYVDALPGYPIRHDCGDDGCPERALCGDCWSNL